MNEVVAIIAVLVAALLALYARKFAGGEKADYIGHLNALPAFRSHYLELITQKGRVVEQLEGMKVAEKTYKEYAELDTKLREVNQDIDGYHQKVVESKT
jgi:hypothetical protein